MEKGRQNYCCDFGSGSDMASLNAIAARICAVVDAGKLEGKGDLSRWGHSEVRRNQSNSALG